MLFGDSTVAGRFIDEKHALHSRLAQLFSEQTVEVINTGTEAYDIGQVYLLMKELVPKYRPDVVVYGACKNDYVAATIASRKMPFPKPQFAIVDGDLHITPPDPTQQIRRYGSGFKLWIQNSALYRMLRPMIARVRQRLMSWEEKTTLGIAQELYFDRSAIDALPWELVTTLIQEMQSVAKDHEATLYLYMHPDLDEVWQPHIDLVKDSLGDGAQFYNPYALEERMSVIAAEHGVPFCPMITPFREQASRGPFHQLPRDPHCNGAGYQLQAEVLARCINEHP